MKRTESLFSTYFLNYTLRSWPPWNVQLEDSTSGRKKLQLEAISPASGLGLFRAALGPEQSGHLKSYVEKSVILITLFLVRSSKTTTTCSDRANTRASTVLWWYYCGEITYWCHSHTRLPIPALSHQCAPPCRFQSALDEGWNHSFQPEAFQKINCPSQREEDGGYPQTLAEQYQYRAYYNCLSLHFTSGRATHCIRPTPSIQDKCKWTALQLVLTGNGYVFSTFKHFRNVRGVGGRGGEGEGRMHTHPFTHCLDFK